MRRKKPVILKRSDHRLDLGPVGYNLFVSRDKQQEERSARRLRAWMRAVIGLVIAGGAVVAGLCTGAGLGLAALWRANRRPRENLALMGALYGAAVLTGFACNFVF